MRILNQPLLSSVDSSVNQNSPPLNLEFAYGFSIQCIFTGSSLAGTVALQGSNDVPVPGDANFNFASFQPTNWTVITGTSQTVSGTGTFLYNDSGAYFRWVRAIYTASSGTGTLSVNGMTKGT